MEEKKTYSKRKCLTCGTLMEIVKTDLQRFNYCEPCDNQDFYLKVCCDNDCRSCVETVEL